MANKGMVVATLILCFVHPACSRAQSGIGVQEIPVVFTSSVTSGKTPSGTKIQARLAMATLINGTVVPQGAKFSGEVAVSQAKGRNQPSRLSVQIDSVSWRNVSLPIKAFLTQWFYQRIPWNPGQSSKSGPVLWNDAVSPSPDAPNTVTSIHREKMKDVDIQRASDGTVTLVCAHCTIELDRSTTYGLTVIDFARKVK